MTDMTKRAGCQTRNEKHEACQKKMPKKGEFHDNTLNAMHFFQARR